MDGKNKRIQIIGMTSTRSLLRFIESQVEKWIARKQAFLFLPKSSSYQVTIEREGEYPYYQCGVEVRIGSKFWKSSESARNLHDALAQALRRMKPVLSTTRTSHEDHDRWNELGRERRLSEASSAA